MKTAQQAQEPGAKSTVTHTCTYLQAVEVPPHRRERGGRVARQVLDGQVRSGLGQRADAARVAGLGGDQRRRQTVLVGEVAVGPRV